jgi:hypothetical protein
VCVEAESASAVEAPMFRVSEASVPTGTVYVAGASGGAYLEIPEGRGNPPSVTSGCATVGIDIPEEGAYTLWVRVWWQGECSNSFRVQVDNGKPFLFGEDATYKVWHWVRYPVARLGPQLKLTPGRHRFVFLNREDGVRLDQVALSTDRRWVPVDVEAVTAGSGS